MTEPVEDFMARMAIQPREVLLRELEERLRVNVGLMVENRQLRAASPTPDQKGQDG